MAATNANLRFAFSKIKSDIFNAIASVLSAVGAGNGHSNPKLRGLFCCRRFRKHSFVPTIYRTLQFYLITSKSLHFRTIFNQ